MNDYSIISKILIIGTEYSGKGGIAVLLKWYLNLFPPLKYVCSHRQTSKLGKLWISFWAYIKVLYYCLFQSVEIVHIHTASFHAFFRDTQYLLLAKLLRKKVILHLHGGKFEEFYKQHPSYCNYICHKADCLVAVSRYFGKIFKDLELNKNIKVIYNAVDEPLYQNKKIYRRELNILFLGAIVENKGVFDILQCLKLNKSYFTNRMVLHIGGVGEEAKLHSLIQKYDLKEFVKYHGWLSREEKELLLSETDIYLQPSYFESLGIAIIEAMNYGIPIIATNTGGIPELVEHEKNGLLFVPGSIDEMFGALKTLIENKALRKEYGEYSLEKAKSFTLHNMKIELYNLYTEIFNC